LTWWGRQLCLRTRFQRVPAGWEAGLAAKIGCPTSKLTHYPRNVALWTDVDRFLLKDLGGGGKLGL